MPNHPHDLPATVGASGVISAATTLLQVAALAAVLVPLGSVAVETATIKCVSMLGGACLGGVGGYCAWARYCSEGVPTASNSGVSC